MFFRLKQVIAYVCGFFQHPLLNVLPVKRLEFTQMLFSLMEPTGNGLSVQCALLRH